MVMLKIGFPRSVSSALEENAESSVKPTLRAYLGNREPPLPSPSEFPHERPLANALAFRELR